MVDESLRYSLRSTLIDLERPKALIIDIFCSQVIDVCVELGIPVYSFMTPSAATTAFVLYLPKLDGEVEGEFVDLPKPVEVPGCRPVRVEDLVEPVKNRKIDEYKWLLFHASRLPKVAGILMNTWEDLEPVSIRAIKENQYYRNILTPPAYLVGPITRQDEEVTKLHGEILNFLDKQPLDSVLFVALGSGGTLSTQQLSELALGLELSRQRFILVARKPHDTDVSSAFFNVGDNKDDPIAYFPQGLLKRVDGVGLVVPEWAPQLKVLCHGSTGGFLSHCGWNSTLESISYGVPMIAWPLYAEQRMNAAMLAEEVGVAIWPMGAKKGKKVVGREEIARVVNELMEGEEGKKLRSRARALQESAKKALDFSGSSFQALSRVAEIWKSEQGTTTFS